MANGSATVARMAHGKEPRERRPVARVGRTRTKAPADAAGATGEPPGGSPVPASGPASNSRTGHRAKRPMTRATRPARVTGEAPDDPCDGVALIGPPATRIGARWQLPACPAGPLPPPVPPPPPGGSGSIGNHFFGSGVVPPPGVREHHREIRVLHHAVARQIKREVCPAGGGFEHPLEVQTVHGDLRTAHRQRRSTSASVGPAGRPTRAGSPCHGS